MDAQEIASHPTEKADDALPSQLLKRTETYWRKQELISECLKDAFILLSGIQLMLRRENLLLTSANFPDELCASMTVNADMSVNVDTEKQEKSLRLWLAGFRPTSDMKEAQGLFQRSLELSLSARKDMEEFTK